MSKLDYKKKSKCWMLTLNFRGDCRGFDNFTAEEKVAHQRFNAAAQVAPCSYCIFQGELGEDTGRYHLQGYAEFDHPMTCNGVKKHFGHLVHAEVREQSQEACIRYCSKEETRASPVVSFGTPMKANKSGGTQGSRTDYKRAYELLATGKEVLDVIEDQPHFIPFVSALSKVQFLLRKDVQRSFKTKLFVFYGDAQSGKTTAANRFAAKYGSYYKPLRGANGVWFDGYNPFAQKVVVIDEFTGSYMSATQLNDLADKWPYWAETKGSATPFLAKVLILTSNYAPEEWYDWANEKKHLCKEALMARIDVLVEFRFNEIKIPQPEGCFKIERKVIVSVLKGTLPFKDELLSREDFDQTQPIVVDSSSDDEPVELEPEQMDLSSDEEVWKHKKKRKKVSFESDSSDISL